MAKHLSRQPSAAQQERARLLCETKACPCCGFVIPIADLLAMLRGDGYKHHVEISVSNGGTAIVAEAQFNPQTMVLAKQS